jgi:type I restriction enzyme, S subunit
MNWPRIVLSEALQLSVQAVEVSPEQVYPTFGVYGFGRGLFDKAPVVGAEISATRLYRASAGQFVYSRLKAFEGAFGLVPPEYNGRYVTNEFPTFTCLPSRLESRYLDLHFRRPEAWAEAARLSTGVGARRERLHPEQFLSLAIPLPAVEEQRRIVARVDAIASRVAEARRLREEADTAAQALFSARMGGLWKGSEKWPKRAMSEIAQTVSGQVDPRFPPYSDLPLISGDSIQSGTGRLLPHYRTAQQDEAISGKYHFPANTVLYSKIRPYLRKATFVPFEGLCSADIYAFENITSDVEPRFLMYSLLAGGFTAYANEVSGRTRMPKLNQNQLFAFQLSIPPLAEQRRIVAHLDALQAKLDAVRAEQSATAAELDALLPSVLNRAFAGEL